MPWSEPALVCDRLVKVYDTPTGRVQAVRGIDMEVEAGAVVAVVGPSGSGKSSLLGMISGLEIPTAGSVRLAGRDLAGLRPGRRARERATLVTHVHQRPADNLLSHLTAAQQLRRLGVDRRHRTRDVDEALDRFGLTARRDHLPGELSGGEQQRLAVARAAVARHGMVIADEPTAELDTASADSVLDALTGLAGMGATVLIATHDPRVIARTGLIVSLRDGAVASVTDRGRQLSVIDRSGRLQLPPEVLDHFPTGRAELTWNDKTGRLEVGPP